MPKQETSALTETWKLSPAATFGSSVRAKGILLEIRASLPWAVRKAIDVRGMTLILTMAEDRKQEFDTTVGAVTEALDGIEDMPVIPREIQDILGITASERHRWLKDGRLASAGTRTVRLSGRARQITFHVFDPRIVEDLLDRGIFEDWREEDAIAKAENRRQAAYKAKLTRSLKKSSSTSRQEPRKGDEAASELRGWGDFDLDGLLR